MSGYILSPESQEDIFEIWSYLAWKPLVPDSWASSQQREIVEQLRFNLAGKRDTRQDLTKIPVLFYRAFPYQYMIIYRREKAGVEIVGVLHAKRDIKKILKQRK
jgi:plasmid stabilization system protein ParE